VHLTGEPDEKHVEKPDHDEAEAAVALETPTPLSIVVDAALRFVRKDHPYVQLFPNMVVGSGPEGIVVHPWNVDTLKPEGHVVDGLALRRQLKSAGKNAKIRPRSDGGIEVLGDGHRFSLALVSAHVATPDYPAADAWRVFDATHFQAAAKFTGDDKIEPAYLAGVCIDEHGVLATDRQVLFMASGGLEGARVVVARNAFDGVAGQCQVALDPHHNLAIYLATGEYRMCVAFADIFPDVRAVATGFQPAFYVAVDRTELLACLRRARIVQRRTSAVALYIGQGQAGPFVELRAGLESESQFTARLEAQFHGDPMLPGGAVSGGLAKVMVSGDNLERLAKAYPASPVWLGFGGDPNRDLGSQPVVMATEEIRAIALTMR
jgi:hypothetical protein